MKKKSIAILMSLLMFSTLVGCGSKEAVKEKGSLENPIEVTTEQKDNKTQDNQTDNKIVLAMNAPTTLNPLYNTQKDVQQALYLIFSPLVNVEQDGTVSANLATSWSINETNTAITLTLGKNIKWHDQIPLTAEDVAFTINQLKGIPDSPYKIGVDNIAEVEVINDLTIKILYKQPFSGVVQTLCFPIIPKHIYDVPENNSLTINPIGSGPYSFVEMTPFKKMNLQANASYFKGEPHIKQIEVTIIPDEESGLHAFKQGLIDAIYTDVTEWGKYVNDKTSTAYEFTSNIYEFLGVNFNKVIFQNANIRKALVYALDRQSMVELYYLNHAIVTDTPISPTSYLFDKTLEIKEHDKEKAKLLLAQEGYEKDGTTGLLTKNNVPLSFSILVNTENKDRVKIAGEMKKMYKEIGIDITVEAVDRETYLSKIENKQYDAFLGGWQLSYTQDLSFALHSSKIVGGQNFVSYNDPKMDELLGKAFLATESTKLKEYSELQRYFTEQNPYISLYFKNAVFIAKNKIKGNVKPSPLNIFSNIEEWTMQ